MVLFAPLVKEIELRTSLPKVSNAWGNREECQTLLHKPAFVISLLGIFGIIVLYSLMTSFYSVFDEANLSPMIGLLPPFRSGRNGNSPLNISWRPLWHCSRFWLPGSLCR